MIHTLNTSFRMILLFVWLKKCTDKIEHYTGNECKKFLHMDSRYAQERKWVIFVSFEIVEAIVFKCVNVKLSLSACTLRAFLQSVSKKRSNGCVQCTVCSQHVQFTSIQMCWNAANSLHLFTNISWNTFFCIE